jgi:hypothetical protein
MSKIINFQGTKINNLTLKIFPDLTQLSFLSSKSVQFFATGINNVDLPNGFSSYSLV